MATEKMFSTDSETLALEIATAMVKRWPACDARVSRGGEKCTVLSNVPNDPDSEYPDRDAAIAAERRGFAEGFATAKAQEAWDDLRDHISKDIAAISE